MKSSESKAVMRRLDALARITDEPGRITRTFCSPAMARANAQFGHWMRSAGMSVRQDEIGNLIGHYPAAREDAKVLLIGSHLDTVRNAGKFDGPMGVMLGIACVEQLRREKAQLPFAIEVIGFSDEEGVRYQTAYLGSRTVVGKFDRTALQRKDSEGITMAEAIANFGGSPAKLDRAKLDPRRLLGYLEAHIEQGPVLEAENLAVGLVTDIAGQSRLSLRFIGRAGHAGTTPMRLRRDALCAAAEFTLAVEAEARRRKGLVATVGQLAVESGASNVIPGAVHLTLDVRHQKDAQRLTAVKNLKKQACQMAARRKVQAQIQLAQQTASVPCSPQLSELLAQSVRAHQPRLISLASGAGHDAAVMAAITPVTMLFVRCKGGISHNPAESATERDISVALEIMTDFIRRLAAKLKNT